MLYTVSRVWVSSGSIILVLCSYNLSLMLRVTVFQTSKIKQQMVLIHTWCSVILPNHDPNLHFHTETSYGQTVIHFFGLVKVLVSRML